MARWYSKRRKNRGVICGKVKARKISTLGFHLSSISVGAGLVQITYSDGTVVTGGNESIAVADGDLPILAKVGDISSRPHQE
ncbi:hypothetical protein ACK330_11070 [Aeromonas taiwanensis]|uniref:hypothetical protein n=1 Tax=Aeromonas taiwanensis TaxID=633417 RepID=UPI0039891659